MLLSLVLADLSGKYSDHYYCQWSISPCQCNIILCYLPYQYFLFWLYAFLYIYIYIHTYIHTHTHTVLNTVDSASIAWPDYIRQLINNLFENNTILVLLSIQPCNIKIREDKRVNTNIISVLSPYNLTLPIPIHI
jgi:hypothetical protein